MIWPNLFGKKPGNPVRLLFSGHDFKFLRPFIEHCRASGLYEVRLDRHKGHQIDSEADAREYSKWADIIFCEWALGNAVYYSQHKRPGQLLVVRLHLQEVQARDTIDFIYKIDWSQVDRLVLITQSIYDWMTNEFPVLRGRACLIYNPIDAAGAFALPKPPGTEHRLGFVGVVPQRKRLDLAVDILAGLLERDDRYVLHVKGRRPEEYSWMLSRKDEMAWYEALYRRIDALPAGKVVFDPHGDDMAPWYADMGFILSTSDFEGSHQAVAEGMAAGCVPVIRRWEGADRIYPPRYAIDSVGEAVHAIERWNTPERMRAEQAYCRQYAVERFDQREICNKLESIFIRHAGRELPAAPGVARAAATPAASTLPPVLLLGYIAPGYRGGYRIRIEQEIRALLQVGCPVHFACLHPAAPADSLRDHREQFERLGCRVHLVPSPQFFDIDVTGDTFKTEIAQLGRVIREHGLELVHAEALYTARLAALLKAACPAVKLVFDAHGATPEEERLMGAHPNRVRAMAEWERRVFAASDLNVFVSGAMREYYRERYDLGDTPAAFVPCCITDHAFPGPDAAAPVAVPPDRPVVAYLGTLAAWQCGAEMMRLFGELSRRRPDLHYLLIMPAGDHEKARELIAANGLAGENVLLAELPHEQVPAALRQAHAAVMLRRDDPVNRVSSPTKFAEYLAAGCPLIMTGRIGDYSALAVQSDIGIALDPALLDEPAWPEAELEKILGFIDRCRAGHDAMARRCRDTAWENLHWEPAIERLAAAYRAVLMAPGDADRPVG
ncbi:MAG: glycosyltransferase family 4 protein [Candidatus Sumerlaeia bacterium]